MPHSLIEASIYLGRKRFVEEFIRKLNHGVRNSKIIHWYRDLPYQIPGRTSILRHRDGADECPFSGRTTAGQTQSCDFKPQCASEKVLLQVEWENLSLATMTTNSIKLACRYATYQCSSSRSHDPRQA